MSHPAKRDSQVLTAKRCEKLSDERLLDLVQRQTFRYFSDGAQPVSGLSGLGRDRIKRSGDPTDDRVATGGSGFGAMGITIAAEMLATVGPALEKRLCNTRSKRCVA